MPPPSAAAKPPSAAAKPPSAADAFIRRSCSSSCHTAISSWCFPQKQHQKFFLLLMAAAYVLFVLRYRQMMVSLTVRAKLLMSPPSAAAKPPSAAAKQPSAAVAFIRHSCSSSCHTAISSWCFPPKQHQKFFLLLMAAAYVLFVLRYRQMMVSLTVRAKLLMSQPSADAKPPSAAAKQPSAAVAFIRHSCSSSCHTCHQQLMLSSKAASKVFPTTDGSSLCPFCSPISADDGVIKSNSSSCQRATSISSCQTTISSCLTNIRSWCFYQTQLQQQLPYRHQQLMLINSNIRSCLLYHW